MCLRATRRTIRPRYLGDVGTLEVHDLRHEEPECRIQEIVAAGRDRVFPTLEAARVAGFDRMHSCIGFPSFL